MKAAFLTGLRQMTISDAAEPRLTNPRDVLLRMESVGVCGSDVHYYTTGRIGSLVVEYPFVVGHECAGTIVEVGSEVKSLSAGQRVAIDPLVACGECDQCCQGRVHTCRHQRFLGCPGQLPGALAEYLVMPAECCYPVPDSMTPDQVALVEPLSIGLYAQRMAQARPGSKVAILGSGPIGLSVLLAFQAAGDYTIYATDLLDERLQAARRCGACWAGNPRQIDVVAEIEKQAPLGVDFVFECAGEQEAISQAVEMLKPGGTLLIVGIPEVDQIRFNIHTLRRKELTLQSVRRQNQCVAPAIELVANGKIDVDQLMTHRFTLKQTQTAFDLVAGYQDGVIKAMINLTDET